MSKKYKDQQFQNLRSTFDPIIALNNGGFFMNYSDGFIERGTGPIMKWDELDLSKYKSITETPRFDELTPFYNTDIFYQLDETEKQNLYYDFARFNTEMFIFFEDLFSDGFKEAIALEKVSEKTKIAVNHLIDEERAHTEAFMSLILSEHQLGWYYKNSVVRSKLIKKFANWIVKNEPIAVLITGAKAEAFSVNYSKYLKKICGSYDFNRHTQVHYLHLLDEVHHVPFQLDLYDEIMASADGMKKARILLFTILFFILMQFVLLKSAFHMISRSLTRLNIFNKIGLTLRMASWTIKNFPPIRDSKEQIRQLIIRRGLKLAPIYQLLYR
jgi:hypothetical protein